MQDQLTKQTLRQKNRWNIYNVAALLIALILSPVTVVLSINVLGDNRYFFLCVLLCIYILIVFFLMFEGKRPDARSVVMIAVMSTIGVVGRAIFFFAPNFKPVLAVVILTGICFGRNIGFITGATTAFVSNFIFGQGPWTPWQMLGMGIIGYLSGLIFENKKFPIWAYCIFGFIGAAFIYGGIVDLWTILGFFGSPTLNNVIAVYTMAMPLNLTHGVATVIFLLILVIPFEKKIQRIKVKYDLIT